jgi:hypothetical protein
MQPKEGGDDMQKQKKSFLVFAESCTEAEARMIEWVPGNYQDAVVTDVKKTNIGELRLKGDSETFFIVKILDDLDGKAEKATPYIIVTNSNHLEDAARQIASDFSGELESISRFKTIVDDDLIKDVVKKVPKAQLQPANP